MSTTAHDHTELKNELNDLAEQFFSAEEIQVMADQGYPVSDMAGAFVAELIASVAERFNVRPEMLYGRALQHTHALHHPEGGWNHERMGQLAREWRTPLYQEGHPTDKITDQIDASRNNVFSLQKAREARA